MLSYAFNILKEDKFQEIGEEDFDFIGDMFAALLIQAISHQLKIGLSKEYVLQEENIQGIKGKVNISESVKTLSMIEKKMVCEFDEFTENIYLNQIIKATGMLLIRSKEINKHYKSKLRKLFLFFNNVDLLEINRIDFNKVVINRNNKNYELIINLCYLIIDGLIIDDKGRRIKFRKNLNHDHMYYLYEKFVLNYFKRHHKYLNPQSTQIKWSASSDNEMSLQMLPNMYTDIVLHGNTQILIMDTKYYRNSLSKRYNENKFHSANLYQLYAYVSTLQLNSDRVVSGMLLYAKTDHEETIDENLVINGHNISFKSLDLNQEFKYIKMNLDLIAENLF